MWSEWDIGGAMKKCVLLFAGLVLALSGCARSSSLPPVSDEVETHYKTTASPPPGYARVYILPVNLNVGGVKSNSQLYIGSSDANKIRVADIGNGRFTAFDIKSGQQTISVTSIDPCTVFLEENKSYFIVPRAYGLGVGANFGLIGAVVASGINDSKPKYEYLDTTSGMTEIRLMEMSSIYPEARSIVRQEVYRPSLVPVAGSPPTPSVGVSQTIEPIGSKDLSISHAPPSPQTVEKTLEDLKRMYEHGLITKTEYDAKRKELLSEIH